MENEQQPTQYNYQEPPKKPGISIGVAITLGISAIIVAAIIAGAIIFASGTKTIRDIDFENFDGFEINVDEDGEETNVQVLVENRHCNRGDQPSISLIAPDGNTSYSVGDNLRVDWETCNISSEYTVAIILDDVNTTEPWDYVLASGAPDSTSTNDGTETIILPNNLVTSNYKIIIRIEYDDYTGAAWEDSSDNAFPINSNNASSCFSSPNSSTVWSIGSTQTITLANAPQYQSHCSNGFSLIDSEGHLIGHLDNITENQGQTSYTFVVPETVSKISCGTGAFDDPQYVSTVTSGQYKIRFVENDTVNGTGSPVMCESSEFTIN